MQEIEGRRPLKVRASGAAQGIAKWLSNKNITPNQISIISVVFAVLAALCLFVLPDAQGYQQWVLPVLAAFFIQCRLLCNLFDGMVAVEGEKGTASGELFNDIPDRIADPLILVAAGFAANAGEWAIVMGWLAGILAVMTAYVRTLAVSIGAPSNFRGPMAKQHRMALMTTACLLSTIEPLLWTQGYAFFVALILVVAGCIVTLILRVHDAYVALEQNQ